MKVVELQKKLLSSHFPRWWYLVIHHLNTDTNIFNCPLFGPWWFFPPGTSVRFEMDVHAICLSLVTVGEGPLGKRRWESGPCCTFSGWTTLEKVHGAFKDLQLAPLNYPCPLLVEKCTQLKGKSECASAAHSINITAGTIWKWTVNTFWWGKVQ